MIRSDLDAARWSTRKFRSSFAAMGRLGTRALLIFFLLFGTQACAQPTPSPFPLPFLIPPATKAPPPQPQTQPQILPPLFGVQPEKPAQRESRPIRAVSAKHGMVVTP